jgi:DNA polymerase III subunit delta'
MELSDLPHISSPMPWHQREWTHLKQQLTDGQLPHALLLVGMEYTGKSQLALALSRFLLCAQTEGSFNCGHCHACELSAGGSHGDFRWVEPGDKSRVIKIEQIRDIVRFTSQKAGLGSRKVIVLGPADSMNVNAFNALLKSLEEPAKDTYLILVCNRMYGVPATIRSRCQITRLATPDTHDCLDWLDKTTGSREKSQQLLALAAGLPLLAQQLYRSDGGQEFAERHLGLKAFLAGSINGAQLATLWSEIDLETFLQQLAAELQDLLSAFSFEQLRTAKGRNAFRLLDEIVRLQQATRAGANPSKQLAIDVLLSTYDRELGPDLFGDNIQAHSREARV